MEYKVAGSKIVVRLDKGDEIISSVRNLMEELNIKCASVSGIGATDDVTFGIYNASNKEYVKYNVKEDLEITSLIGNLTRQNGAPYLHLHINLAGFNGVYGGHLNRAIISVTSEIFIDVIDTEVERKLNEEIGINLMVL